MGCKDRWHTVTVALDSNVLVLLSRTDIPASRWLHSLLDDAAEAVDIPVFCLGEFLRVVTEPGRDDSIGTPRAFDNVDSWLGKGYQLLQPQPEYWDTMKRICGEFEPRGADIFDLQIAAVCLDLGVDTIWTFDRRFPPVSELRVVDPLQVNTGT
jgi:predicted nucleic acid-binding protein